MYFRNMSTSFNYVQLEDNVEFTMYPKIDMNYSPLALEDFENKLPSVFENKKVENETLPSVTTFHPVVFESKKVENELPLETPVPIIFGRKKLEKETKSLVKFQPSEHVFSVPSVNIEIHNWIIRIVDQEHVLRLLPKLSCSVCSKILISPVLSDSNELSCACHNNSFESNARSNCQSLKMKNPLLYSCLFENLKVYCPRFSHEGCMWIGKYDSMMDHLNSSCLHVPDKCIYCSKYFLRHDIEKHRQVECLSRPIQCSSCTCIITFNEMSIHVTTECKNQLINCSNSDCSIKVLRKELSNHLKTCGKSITACSYGCNGSMLKEQVDHHNTCCALVHVEFLSRELSKYKSIII